MEDTSADGMELSTSVLSDAPAVRFPSARFYRPELDGLRFYAFAGVFACHTLRLDDAYYRGLHLPAPWLWVAVVRAGTSGVDLFFALSAFLITSRSAGITAVLRQHNAIGPPQSIALERSRQDALDATRNPALLH